MCLAVSWEADLSTARPQVLFFGLRGRLVEQLELHHHCRQWSHRRLLVPVNLPQKMQMLRRRQVQHFWKVQLLADL